MLQITATDLVLTDPSDQRIWNGEINPTATVSYGAMLDTGNFVLVGTNSDYLWESFKNPTDTILPSQTLEYDTVLFSRLSETNFSRGRFELYFDNGDIKLCPLAWPTDFQYKSYFSNGTSASGSQLVFNESPDIYMMQSNGTIVQLPWKTLNTAPSVAGNYYRATMDYTGVLTQYSYPKGSNATAACQMAGLIGRAQLDSPMDRNNPFGGCKPNFPLGCGVGDASENLEELYELQELKNVNWPLGDYERLQPYSEDQCRTSCLQDCLCDVAIFGNSICWKKRIPLGNGRFEIGNSKALIKVRKGPWDYPGPTCSIDKKEKSILLGSLSASLVLNAFLLILAPLILFLKPKRKSDRVSEVLTPLETNLHVFTYKELQDATINFKEQVGRGSSAIVYKGILKFAPNNAVAVKKLDKLSQEADKEFRNELKAIGKTCHKNLVRLLGFCEEGAHRLLVYEFMTNVKLLLCGQSRTLTNIRGTRGYVAPEWFRNVDVTAKVDVYSFGVLLLEIICCRKNVSKLEHEEILTDWVYDCFVEGRIDDVVEFDKEAEADKDRVSRWVSIAIWCIQEDPLKRPSIKMALQMLEGSVEVPLPPIRIFSSTYSDFESSSS
ncbi:hypothetical protein GH714_014591 [Hevea brasiliensis]|uniref:non-specific serine/threonine protein kinase n=1 Tax=Hevea brasiliensis TaxID=3981 RepID=A0A6A6KPY6_HEVBR|nr:hypothetical protein GH714_014591 [Hevea brasiliensis]